MPMKRAHIIYTGTVQGVGFRWTVQGIADSAGITGWVRNCPDGTVEVVCEGEKDDIDIFLNRIYKEMGPYIKSRNVNWNAATSEFDRFGMKFFE